MASTVHEKDTEEVTDSNSAEEESTVKGAIVDIPKRVLDITMYRLQSAIMI